MKFILKKIDFLDELQTDVKTIYGRYYLDIEAIGSSLGIGNVYFSIFIDG